MFWRIMTIFGSLEVWIGITVVSFIIFLITKKWRKKFAWFVLTVLPSVFLSRFITEIFKNYFKITRPCSTFPFCPSTYSFPSGHATVIFAAVTSLSLHYKDKRLGFLLYIFSGLVALSRLMLGVHRIEDVVIGSIIGIITGFLVQKVYYNYKKELLEIVS